MAETYNKYGEYILVNGKYERIGNKRQNLANYALSADLNAVKETADKATEDIKAINDELHNEETGVQAQLDALVKDSESQDGRLDALEEAVGHGAVVDENNNVVSDATGLFASTLANANLLIDHTQELARLNREVVSNDQDIEALQNEDKTLQTNIDGNAELIHENALAIVELSNRLDYLEDICGKPLTEPEMEAMLLKLGYTLAE